MCIVQNETNILVDIITCMYIHVNTYTCMYMYM